MIFWKRVQQAINNLWYPRSVTVGKPVETQELANRIARESTVSPADTHAVLRALPNIMADFMKESRAIHIEGLGWFRYTTVAAGNGVEKKEDVSSDQITGLRVQFTPDRTRNMSGGYTRALIADEGVTFMEWLGKDSDETQIPEEPEAGGEGSFGQILNSSFLIFNFKKAIPFRQRKHGEAPPKKRSLGRGRSRRWHHGKRFG